MLRLKACKTLNNKNMPNIYFSTEGLTVYNITEIGGSDTGAYSEFAINPLPGYYIHADQFSASAPGVDDIYSSIVFQNTTAAGLANNTVNVKVYWDGTTTITEDYILNITIFYDSVAPASSSSSTNVSYTFQTPLALQNISIQSLSLQNVQTLNHEYIESATGVFEVSFTSVTASSPVEVGRFRVSLDNPSQEFFDGNGSAFAVGGAMAQLQGNGVNFNPSFTFDYEYESNAFGDNQAVIVTVFYTAEQDLSTDNGAVVQMQVPPRTSYYLYFVNTDGQTINDFEVSFSGGDQDFQFVTNVPYQALEPVFSQNWLVEDTDNIVNSVETQFAAIPGGTGTRESVITMQDIYYGNSDWGQTSFLTVVQNEGPYADLRIGLESPDANGNLYQYTTSNGKVISTPNTGFGQNIDIVNIGQVVSDSYDPDFVGDTTYRIKLSTNETLTANQISSGFSVVQTGYPIGSTTPADWVVFTNDLPWVNESPGVWVRDFYIRNNDLDSSGNSSDRTATLRFTHPNDPGIVEGLDIVQDATYVSTVDTVETKISYGTVSPSTTSAYSSTQIVNSNISAAMTAVLKIKMADWENNFNLPNDTNTQDTAENSDIYKQYKRPKVIIEHSGEIENQDGFVNNPYPDFFIASEVATYNSNYNAGDPNNDHQYYLNIGEIFANSQGYSRRIDFRVFHSQNPNQSNGQEDSYLGFTQANNDVVQVEYELNNTFVLADTSLIFANNENTRTFKLSHSGTTPTIGLWNVSTGTYTALASNTYSSNGAKYLVDGVWPGSPPLGLFDYLEKTLKITFNANPGFSARNEVFGFWHQNSNTAVDNPDATLSVVQDALVFDPEIYTVVFDGTQPETIAISGTTLSYNVKVGGYSQANYDADENIPQYSVERVTSFSFPALGQIINDADNIINSTSIAKNNSWTVGSGEHTHTISVTFNAHTSDVEKYFAVRVKHSANNQDSWQDTTVSKINTAPAAWINQIPTNNENSVVSVNIITSQQTNAQGTPTSATASVNHSSYNFNPSFGLNGWSIDKFYLYPNNFDFIFARFLNNSEEAVQDTSGGVISEPNMYGLIPRTPQNVNTAWSGSSSGFIGLNTNLGLVLNGNVSPGDVFPTYTINENASGGSRSIKIGLWTGDTVPKTNLVNTNQTPTFTYYGNSLDLPLPLYSTNVFPNQTYTATQGLDLTYNSFNWNPTDVEVWGDASLSSNYIVMELATTASITQPEEFGLEFTISDLQYNGEEHVIGINSGWFENVYDSVPLNDLQNYLKVTENGTYYARVKCSTSNPVIKFLLRPFARFNVNNIKFWKIEKDAALELNQVITSTPPSYILTLNQEGNPDVGSIAFPNGSPQQGFSPLGPEYQGIYGFSSSSMYIFEGISQNGVIQNINSLGQLEVWDLEPFPNNVRLSFNLVNSSTGEPWSSPFAALWNGSNYYNDPNVLVVGVSGNTPEGTRQLRFSPVYDTAETYTIGFWPSTPANSAVPPTLTQTIIRHPYGEDPV